MIENATRIMSFKIDAQTDSLNQFIYFDTFSNNVSFDSITICRLDDQLLIGTTTGTYRIVDNEIVENPAFNTAIGKNVFIESIKTDKNGNNWFLGKLNGKDIIGKISIDDSGSYKIDKFTKPLHRLSNYLITMFYPYDDENIFIGTSEKVILFNPKKAELTKSNFSVYINHVKITKPADSIIFGGTFIEHGKAVSTQPNSNIPVLPFRYNALRFSYSALFYEEAKNIEYQYKLEGYNENWSDWQSEVVKEYNYLPEGKYTFCVRAKNIFEIESEVASYRFIIKPPLYRSYYAYSIYLIVLAVLIYLLIQIGIQRVQKENTRLEDIVTQRTEEVVKQKQEILDKNQQLVEQNTDIRKQTDQLKELNTIKDKLFSIIAHDLRSPLLSLYMLLSLVKDKVYSEERFKIEIEKLSARVGHTRELTEILLSWAQSQLKGNQIHPTSILINQMVGKKFILLEQQANTKGISLHNNIDPSTTAFADKNMIDIVLRNLISNAIKFCSAGDEISLSSKTQNNTLTICVCDTGKGISTKNTHKLFGAELFSTYGTNKEKGSGLGLMLCKDFINLNGGTIWVESKEGEGSKFYFTLPGKM